ncbi:MAG: ATP-binding protein [Theionarchaea archaeon]|nr:ATP-binding protein [Theionarchaea archaeon]MBU7037336.1 ATP-binding protein [Theionarchaea archaeon]
MWSFTDLENKKTLITGEVHTGKTYLTQTLLQEAESLTRDIAVIDMAPEPTKGVGGKLHPTSSETEYYTTEILTPRLSGKTAQEVIQLAETNKERIDVLFQNYIPRAILFINDVSIYLQRGSVRTVLHTISSSRTVIMNGYLGTSLGEDPFSQKERESMLNLQKSCDILIRR